jgi:prolyl-tRNA synthetase
VAKNIKSRKDLPLLLYQFQMKYRDEIRPRFGVMRAREFYMKDAYSFDASQEGCKKSYQDNVDAYNKIFSRCGLDFVMVEAETGAIGGHYSHEFMVIADTGEEEIAVCRCGYGSNSALAEYKLEDGDARFEDMLPLEEVRTPDARTVGEVAAFLKESPEKFIKTLIYKTGKGPIAALVRGDRELNENLLKTAAGVEDLEMADEQTIQKLTGGPLGFSGPVGLKAEIFADPEVTRIDGAISGANKKDYHLKNIYYERDYKAGWTGNLRKAVLGDLCGRCGGDLNFRRGIEVGHTFLLGTKYSRSMEAKFADVDGKEEDIIMGCYGIGVTRVVAAAIEQNHDENGIIWPRSIAPFEIMMLQLSKDTDEFCKKLYEDLSGKYEVLWDDRDESPGVKFKDAQLIGIPIQIIIGKKYSQEGKLEIQYRKTGKKEYVTPEKLMLEVQPLT